MGFSFEGAADFDTGTVWEHRREDMATMKAGFIHDPDAECPRFDRFVDEVACGDSGLGSFLLRTMAYSLTGFTDIDDLPFHHGDGGNGKGVFVGLLERLLGPYFMRVSYDSLFAGRNGSPVEYAKAEFRGRRLVVTTEIPSDRRLEEHVVKDLVGGDTMTGRRPYERPITFQPSHKLWMCGNHRPVVKDTDNGIWRRLKLVPWNARFEGNEESRSELIEEMTLEGAGILNWLLDAWRQVQRDGIGAPDCVMSATDEYRADEDQVKRYIDEQLVQDADQRVTTTIVHKAYLDWCDGQGESPVAPTARKFVPELRRLGLAVGEGRARALHVDGMRLRGEDGELLSLSCRKVV